MVDQSLNLKTRRSISSEKLNRLHRFEHFLVSQLGMSKAVARKVAPTLDSTLDEALSRLSDPSRTDGAAKSA